MCHDLESNCQLFGAWDDAQPSVPGWYLMFFKKKKGSYEGGGTMRNDSRSSRTQGQICSRPCSLQPPHRPQRGQHGEREHRLRSRGGLPCTQLHHQEAVFSCRSQGLAEPGCSAAEWGIFRALNLNDHLYIHGIESLACQVLSKVIETNL